MGKDTKTLRGDDPEKGETDPLILKTEAAKAVVKQAGPEGAATDPSFSEDCWDTIKLGAPIFVAMLSWVGVSELKY
jgi:hypothetical protein